MHFENKRMKTHWASALAVLLVAGVASTLIGCVPEQSAVRDDFGNSVRSMIASQTYQPGEDVGDLDGGKAVNTMGVYRNSVSKPKAVRDRIIFNVAD